jgi:hypothetical protein
MVQNIYKCCLIIIIFWDSEFHYTFLVNCSWLYFMYHAYQFGGNASVALSLLSIDLERNVKCYNWYFINRHVFHIKKYR